MTAPKHRTIGILQRIALLSLALLLGLPLGCGGDSATLQLHYAGRSTTAPSGIKFNAIKFKLVPGDSSAEQDWNQKAPTWTNDKADPLPTIECPVDANGWTGYRPAPGAPSALSPYLHVFSEGSSNTQLEGRFPLHVACSRPGFSIFFAAPWQLSTWRDPTKDGTKLARIGHRVTRIADGRYVISGGAASLDFGNFKTPFRLTSTSQTLLIYDPTTGNLTEAQDPLFGRAFHSAEWNRGRILLTGGINDKGMVTQSALIHFTGRKEIPEDELAKLNCDSTPDAGGEILCVQKWPPDGKSQASLAFQKTLRVPKTQNAQEATTIQIGGVSSSTDMSKGIQSLFHTATYLPGKRSILVTGGFYFDNEQSAFRATNFVYELELDANNKFKNTPKIGFIEGMAARAGHTATRIDDDTVLLIGGVFGAVGSSSSSQDAFGGHTSIEVLRRKGSSWESTRLDNKTHQSLSRRAFHSATKLLGISGNTTYIHITGGVAWTLGERGAVTKSKTAPPSFVLAIEKNDKSPGGLELTPFKFDDTANEPTNGNALQSATTFETGLLVYLGGAQQADHKPGKDSPQSTLSFSAATGTSLIFMPGSTKPPTLKIPPDSQP